MLNKTLLPTKIGVVLSLLSVTLIILGVLRNVTLLPTTTHDEFKAVPFVKLSVGII